jgi:hypothetical protein
MLWDWWTADDDGSSGSGRRRDRGQATQFDFVVSMGLRAFILAAVVAASLTVVGATATEDYSGRSVAKRSADRLAADLLVANAGDVTLDRDCTQAYFQADTSTCGYADSWSSSGEEFLHDSLAVSHTYRVNATIETPNDKLATLDGTTLGLGPDPSTATDKTVHSWYRRRPIDMDGDGTARTYTIYVRVWRV